MKVSFGPINGGNTNIVEFINEKQEEPIKNNVKTYILEVVLTFTNNLYF